MFRSYGQNLRRWWGVRWPFWIVAVLCALPIVQIIGMISIVGLLGMGIFAALTFLGPVYVGVAAALDRVWSPASRLPVAIGTWKECALVWACSAFGISRMGDVGQSMGFKNMPYHEAFFGPVTLLYSVLT